MSARASKIIRFLHDGDTKVVVLLGSHNSVDLVAVPIYRDTNATIEMFSINEPQNGVYQKSQALKITTIQDGLDLMGPFIWSGSKVARRKVRACRIRWILEQLAKRGFTGAGDSRQRLSVDPRRDGSIAARAAYIKVNTSSKEAVQKLGDEAA